MANDLPRCQEQRDHGDASVSACLGCSLSSKKAGTECRFSEYLWYILGCSVLGLLFIVSRYNATLFHGMAEVFSIALAWAVFMLVWSARRFVNNDALLLLGSAFLFIGFIDLLHVLALLRPDLFFDAPRADLSSQLLLASRFIEGLAMLLFALFLGRSLRPFIGLAFWAGLALSLLAFILYWQVFPTVYVPGGGWTPFSAWSGVVICLGLLTGLVVLFRRRSRLDVSFFQLICLAMIASLAAEALLLFFVRAEVHSNFIDHFLKIIAYMCVYLALIRSGVTRPFELLFQDLEREKTELLATKQHLNLIFDTAPALIWQKDGDGRYLQVNKAFCQAVDMEPQRIIGKVDDDIFPPKIAQKYVLDDQEVLQSGRNKIGIEEQYVGTTGKLGWIVTDKLAYRDRNGNIAGTIGFAKDITERKQAQMREKVQQEQLVQAAKMTALGTLVAGVAHEVNNPNNFIILNAPLLEEVWADSLPVLEAHHAGHSEFMLAGIPYPRMRDNVARLFSGIHEGSKRIKRIVAELKSFARQTPLNLNREVQLNQVVEAALTMLRKTIDEHTTRFEMRLDSDIPPVRGDFQKLVQVVVNLLINACQALPDKDRRIVLEIYSDPGEGSVVLRITDEGEGIASEHLEQICDPFFSTRHDIGGTGLGLSITSSIIQSHQGRMDFDSAPGLGTTVTIFLKAAS
ncbi:MAG: PAS domain S-box protein [Desulfovibrionales bacterium]|nr:MAG: PAS domain S-box protein [Desulfovibrionales bacterium]